MDFRDNFWNIEFNNNSGFEAITERLQHGKIITSAILDFIKTRARIEDDYAKQLTKLSRNEVTKTSGSFGRGWRALVDSTERLGQTHKQKSIAYEELCQELVQFANEQNRIRKSAHANVQKLQQQKKLAYDRVLKSKTDFQKKKAAMENQEQHVDVIQWESTKTKEYEKAVKNLNRSQKVAYEAEDNYKQTVSNLESVRKQWETSMENGFDVLQGLEEKRITYLRQLFWRLTNVDTAVAVQVAQQQQQVRGELKQCSVSYDMEHFVQNKRTGAKRPDPITIDQNVILPKNKVRTNTNSSLSSTTVSVNSTKDGQKHEVIESEDVSKQSKNGTTQSNVQLEKKQLRRVPLEEQLTVPVPNPRQLGSHSPTQKRPEDTYSTVLNENPPVYTSVQKSTKFNRQSNISQSSVTSESSAMLDSSFQSAGSSIDHSNEEKNNNGTVTGRKANVRRTGVKPPVPVKRISAEMLQKSTSPLPSPKIKESDEFCVVTAERKDKEGNILLQKNSLVKLVRRNSNAMCLLETESGDQILCPSEFLDIESTDTIRL